jgi:hypothetical protein
MAMQVSSEARSAMKALKGLSSEAVRMAYQLALGQAKVIVGRNERHPTVGELVNRGIAERRGHGNDERIIVLAPFWTSDAKLEAIAATYSLELDGLR